MRSMVITSGRLIANKLSSLKDFHGTESQIRASVLMQFQPQFQHFRLEFASVNARARS